MKEALRLILRCNDRDEADLKLKKWYRWASHSRIDSFKELAKKIKRNRDFILNTISYGLSNARIEATNNKIKLLVRRSYGFRNIDSMLNTICPDMLRSEDTSSEQAFRAGYRSMLKEINAYLLPTSMPKEPIYFKYPCFDFH